MKEIWRTVPGLPRYSASNRGRIRGPLKVRKPQWNKGYAYVGIGGRNYAVHALVLLAFKEAPGVKQHGAHRNGRPWDNRASNLCWASCRENQAHRLRHGTHQRGSKNHRALLSEADVRKIRRALARGARGKDLATRYGVTPAAISWVKRRVNWKHVA